MQRPAERVHLVVARPYHLREVDQAFVAAAPAADLEQLEAGADRIRDRGRGRRIAADELPRVPFLAGQRMGAPEGLVDLGHQRSMRLLGRAQLADVMPAIAAGQREMDDAGRHGGIKARAAGSCNLCAARRTSQRYRSELGETIVNETGQLPVVSL
jgi:hypothetical protein